MRVKRRADGFTLLELMVVSVLIAITLALTVPRVQGLFFNDPLSRSTRVLVTAINEARETALESGRASLLQVDFSSGSITLQAQREDPAQDQPSKAEPVAVRLEGPVIIASAWTHSSGRKRSGTMPIRINGRGMIEPAIIELRDTDRFMSLKLSPFLPEAEIYDRALPPPSALLAGFSVSR